jgi:Flp pilus assembly protein TadD
VYRLDEASFWTNQLRKHFPENPSGRLLDAQMQDTLRHRDQAQEIAAQLVDDYPKYDKARLYFAGLLFKTNQYEQALPHYHYLRRRLPDDLEPLVNLASALAKLERWQEAQPLFRELQARHADNAQAQLECGRFALLEERAGDAEPMLRRAAELAPFDHEIQLELATCLERLGQADESRRHLARFQQIEADMKLLDAAFKNMIKAPSDPGPRLEAGRICLRNGQETEGLRWLYGVLDLQPDHPVAHQMLADFYRTSGDPALARHHSQFRSGMEKQQADADLPQRTTEPGG